VVRRTVQRGGGGPAGNHPDGGVPSWSATRSRPTSSGGTGPQADRRVPAGGWWGPDQERGAGPPPGGPTPISPPPSTSRPTSTRLPWPSMSTCIRSPSSAGTSRACTAWAGRPAAGPDRVRHRLAPRGGEIVQAGDALVAGGAPRLEMGVAGGRVVFSFNPTSGTTGGLRTKKHRELGPSGLGPTGIGGRKPAFQAVQALVRGRRAARRLAEYPKVSVVICAYNAEPTMAGPA